MTNGSSTPQQPSSEKISERVAQFVKEFKGRKGAVIPLLQRVQSEFGYVPPEAVEVISREMDIFPVDLYGILTFYAQFYLEPRGKHTIRVCQGTACYVMGGKTLLDQLADDLKVEPGGTSPDGQFTLETVACLGCCGMAPVIMVDSDFYGNVTMKQLDEILETYGGTPREAAGGSGEQ